MKRDAVLLGLTLSAGLALRLYGIGARSLWLDEALSWRLQAFSLPLLLERTGEPTTTHPPLYFAVLGLWNSVFGDSEIAMRSLSALCGTLTAAGMYFLVRELFQLSQHGKDANSTQSSFAGLLGSVLVAFNCFQVHLSQQVRGYTLATLLIVLSSYALLRALLSERNISTAWAIYAMLSISSLYTHNLSIFSIAAQAVFIALFFGLGGQSDVMQRTHRKSAADLVNASAIRNATWLRPLVAIVVGLVVFLAYLPWIPNLIGQSDTLRQSWAKTVALGDFPREIANALVATSASRSMDEYWLACGVTVAVIGAVGFVLYCGRWAGLYIALTGLLPVVAIAIYSGESERSIFQSRYLAFAQLSWLVAFAIIAAWPKYRPERCIIAGCLLAWLAYSCVENWQQIGRESKGGAQSAAQFIKDNRMPEEVVVATTPFEFFKMLYYFRESPSPPLLCSDSRSRQSVRGAAHLQDSNLISGDQINELDVEGFWLVTSSSYDASAKCSLAIHEPWIEVARKRFNQDASWENPVTVICYRRQEADTLPAD